MSEKDSATRERILETAKKEFLCMGFQAASLRNIVKSAGVTTGSFYWYFNSKEELFEAIVREYYEHILDIYDKTEENFTEMSEKERRACMNTLSSDCFLEMLEYMYSHITEFKILIRGSEGTKYGNIVHELTEREIKSTQKLLKDSQVIKKYMYPELTHIVVSGMFAGLFEIINHDYPFEKAKICVRGLHDFYTAGFAYIMDMPPPT